MILKKLFTLILSTMFVFSLTAQEDCDCPESNWETEGICVEVMDDNMTLVAWAPDECLAACWYGDEYTLTECDDIDWEWEDPCDCPEQDWESEGLCIEIIDLEYDSIAFTTWVPNECLAACWYEEYTLTDCDDIVIWDDCDCPQEDWESEGICVEITGDGIDSLGVVTWVPSECYAACWYDEYTLADCDDIFVWEECDCPDDNWDELICIYIGEDTTYTEWVPSECFAACWFGDYTLAECDDNNWEWEDECDCPAEDWESEGICIEILDTELDTFTFIAWVPSECYAACYYDSYTVADCDNGWEWEDECDCPEEDWNAEGICVEIIEVYGDTVVYSYIEWAPSECLAACWYGDFTVVECYDWDVPGGGCDWDLECDCEFDSEEGICILFMIEQDTIVEWVPNVCLADCWGYENYAVVDCEDFWDWDEEDNTDIEIDLGDDCVTALLDGEITTFQAFLLGLDECGIFELDECVLGAPTFATDEEFIDYLVDTCPDWFGFVMDESEGPSVFSQFGEMQDNVATTSTSNIIEALDVVLLGNPVIDQLDIQINASDALNLNMTLRSVTGSTLKTENIKLNKGSQVYSVNTAEMAGGTYLMTMISDKGTQTIKFVVAK